MAELEALQESLEAFRAAGASLIAACPQRAEDCAALGEASGLDFPVVQDAGNAAGRAFRLVVPTPPDVQAAEAFLGLDLPALNGTDDWDLPLPARYVLDADGRVIYSSVHADHTRRSDPAEALRALRAGR